MTPPAFRLLLAQSLDAATFAAFYVLIGAGVHAERNPLLIGLMAFGGIQAVVLLKIAIALVVSWRHDHSGPLSPRYLALRTIAVSVATASGIAGAGWNLAAIVSSVRPL